MPTLTFRNTADKHRFEALSDGELAGYVEYNPMEGGLVFSHTEVLKAGQFTPRTMFSRIPSPTS